MPIALANIRSELLPGLFDVRGSYEMIPKQWDKVFKTPQVQHGGGAFHPDGVRRPSLSEG